MLAQYAVIMYPALAKLLIQLKGLIGVDIVGNNRKSGVVNKSTLNYGMH